MANNGNVEHESDGVDTNRKADVIPDHLLIGGGRRGVKTPTKVPSRLKAAAKPPVEEEADDDIGAAEGADSVEELDEGSEEAAEESRKTDDDDADDAGEENAEPQGEDEADRSDLSDDELADLLFDDVSGQTKRAEKKAESKGDVLTGEYETEYKRAVEKHGEELADELFKPMLLREQRRDAQLAEIVKHHSTEKQRVEEQRVREVATFFSTKSKGGFAKVYGDDPLNEKNPLRLAAMQKVINKAIEFREKADAIGVEVSTAALLEKAHKNVWRGTKLAGLLDSKRETMERRASVTTTPAGGSRRPAAGGDGKASGDPYAKARKVLKEALKSRKF